MGYLIIPGCTGPSGETLALAVGEDGSSIVVADASEVTINLMWQLVYDAASGNFAMVSEYSVENGSPSALGLAGTNDGQIYPLALVPLVEGLGAQTTWDVTAGGNALAVRPAQSTSLNLNVQGGGPYPPGNPVIAWDGWGNGTPNEVWSFKPFGGLYYPWNYAFSPEADETLFLSANPQDPAAQLTLQPPSAPDSEPGPEQLWAGMYSIQGTQPLGAYFVNSLTEMVMRSTPNGGPVTCVQQAEIDEWSMWSVAGAPDVGVNTIYTKPNTDLYLNGQGCGPGETVITYLWEGGEDNEQWLVTSVPHEVT